MSSCKECVRRRNRERRRRNRDKELERMREYYRDHKENIRIVQKKSNQKLKSEILTYYGQGECACVVCGEDRLACLSIDHINGGGSKHRKDLQKTAYNFYRWLRSNDWPQGYQTLCMNCQFIKKVDE